ncbi:MAG: TonB-dependent receptor [Proteobacteria bacterium]|nr:TonB-dependent receptor [Pseudomonadota bacterium]
MQSSLGRKWLTNGLTFALSALGLCVFSGTVSAQGEQVEEITVTGSRIARDANLTGALPVQSVSEQEIQMSGEFSLTDVVNDVPALLSSTSSESSIDSAFSDGANILNLRGLGSNRTLTLVDGRRHVGGVQGSAAVDVGSIPMRLVERVEVLTGGASAIYGADAVTGVVNFILKDDYEGFNIDASYGMSGEADGAQTALTATWGTNFAGDRGNIAVSVDYRTDEGLKMGDRPGANFGTGGDWVNPALRFQRGEIGGSTPLFEQYYDYTNTGLINYGLRIPTADSFIANYNTAFGTTLTTGDLSSEEMALISRAATPPQRAVHPEVTFPFTGGYGYVGPGEGFGFGGWDAEEPVDLNNNGTPDCLDSFTGYNSSLTGAASFGVVGGCWRVDQDGSYSVVEDGLVSGNFQGFGGSSYDVYRQDYYDFLLPDDKVSVNVMGHFDVTDSTTLFGELKYVSQETDTAADPNSFWDLILGQPDNPFLPPFLQTIAASTGGVSITPDPIGFRAHRTTERDTFRAVVGMEGELDNGWGYEISANYGRFEQEISRTNQIVNDRWFAALDATTDVNGNPVCRSSIDPLTPPGNTPFEIPAYEAGYFTFTPGDGSCVPLDMWNGLGGITQAAKDFMTTDTWDKLVMDQFVFSAFLTGDSSGFFEMPAGAISFAAGLEYRDESSDAQFDPWQRGVIPAGAPFAAGTQISDYSANSSLVFRPQLSTKNENGSYDVTDVFVEASIPLLRDAAMAKELTLDFAARLSDYSTIGQTTTWKTNLIWAPADSFAVRGTYSEAVRAPNITELFGPEVGLNFRPDDPCDAAQIAAIAVDNPTLAAQTQANCVAVFNSFGLDPFVAGVYSFADPLSASFGGLTGGNRLLQEETAETFTIGFVFQPDFVQGLSLTVDYWDISIADAIEAVSAQNIVDGCYQGAVLNTAFCALSGRNEDPLSAQYGGFNFLRQTTLNFAKVETSGIDFSVKYAFEVGAHGFDATVQGTQVDEINDFENPLDPTFSNPELVEINRPEFAGNVFLNWTFGDLRVGWQSQYMGEMLFGGIEVETAQTLYGRSVFQEANWQHDLSASYFLTDDIMVYGGVKNVTDEQPFITENAFPYSPRGTFFFFGVDYTMK